MDQGNGHNYNQVLNNSIQRKLSQMGQKKNDNRKVSYYMYKMQMYYAGIDKDSAFSALYRDHFLQSFHALGFVSMLKPVPEEAIRAKNVSLERRPTLFNKTIVLDLDETLIHCNENLSLPADTIVSINFPNGETIQAGINIRPYVH